MNAKRGRLAVVTGASTGIGLELARLCAQQRFHLIIAADEPLIEDAARELAATGVSCTPVLCDLATAEGVARFVRDRDYPFPLLADTEHAVFDAYDVANRLMSLGQRPAVFVIDRDAIVRFDAIGTQQWQIPANDTVLKLAAAL